MKKIKRKIIDSFPLVSFLDEDSLETLKRIGASTYKKEKLKKPALKEEKDFGWWKKLMEKKPEKGGYHKS